jgi:uncharacterized membrane protein (TIGR02234 family)
MNSASERGAAGGPPAAGTTAKRQYGYTLLIGAVGAGLTLLALRAQWAQAVFTPQKPLSAQVVGVSGTDLVPLAEALALATLAGLVAVIATKGLARRIVGALIALFGAGTGAAALTAVSAATVVSVAAGKVASPESAALSGTAAGSTTSGASGGGAIVVGDSVGRAIMSGTPWQAAVIVGALLIFAAGLATALRGQDWPVMSARYDAPGSRAAAAADGAGPARAADAASMWESLNGGDDPTEDAPPTRQREGKP